MATFTAIKNATQSGGALGRALDYVKQKQKVLWGDRQLVSGWNCVAQSAYDEMMTTKQRYGKTDGRMFYQFVQSFSPAEDVTPEEVHAIGLELAQRLFPEYEVLVATHVDTDHLHNHLIINSVSCTTGRKLHQNAADLQRQRQISDQICMAHGLQVLKPATKYERDKKMRPGEYRSAAKGQSWKFQLMATIDFCMRRAKRKVDFIREMERRGYQVRWEESRKAITYTTPTGKKCRDDRLHGEKYRKEMMEREFRIREAIIQRRIEAEELAARDGNALGGRCSNAGTHPGLSCGGTVAADGDPTSPDRETAGADHGAGGGLPDSAQSVPGNGAADGAGEGAEGGAADGGDDRTGWEEERAAAFTSQAPPASAAPAQSKVAVGYPGHGGLAGDLVRLGHRLEQSAETVPVADPPVNGHIDRKRWAELQEKRLATGHRLDDNEQRM